MAASFLANFFLWTGVAVGGIAFAALVEVCGGHWAGPLRIQAERFVRFLPVAVVAFVVLIWRDRDVYPWGRHVVDGAWFRPALVALRDAVALVAVWVSALAFCRASARGRKDPSARSAQRSAIVFLLVYAVGFSMLAIDLIMSLEPRWTSTLFPAYVFSGNIYAGTAAVAVTAAWTMRDSETPARSRDTANLLVGLALFWVYLFWSQFLVIWYGNVTAEVGFLMARIGTARPLGWVILALCCAIPAVVLVPQWGKTRRAVRSTAMIVLAGMWLERWLLVAPDLPSTHTTAAAITITAAFALAFLWSVRAG